MRVAIIGRTEGLYNTALRLKELGHQISLIVTAKEAPEYKKTSNDFQTLAEKWGIPFVHAPRIEEEIDTLGLIPQVDIGVSVNYTGLIPQAVIDQFAFGILNAHGGDLPRYKGNACQAWAILNGEDRVGLCIHRMIGHELDSGDIVARDFFALTQDTKVTAVYEWMMLRIPELFSDALAKIAQDPSYVLARQSNDPKESLRCYPRRPEDGRISWGKSNAEILRLINACNKPYAGAFCEHEGGKLIIWDALIAPHENFVAIPGQVTAIETGFVEVACGTGKLRLREVEYAGSVCLPSTVIHSLRQRLS